MENFNPNFDMIYLNFTDLNEEAQQRLLSMSKREIEEDYGEYLKIFAHEHNLDYDTLLYEKAERNLQNYNFVFNI